MSDFYFSEAGDLKVSSNRDIAQTESTWREDAQQAYIRILTEPGDFLLYPNLGAEMSQLYGMPQKELTAEVGKQIIKAALGREGAFVGRNISVNAAPTGPQTIRFDVYVASGSRKQIVLSIEQNLGVQ